jgi:predicted ATP-grasp superfamily ATP-dependent carboligase
MMKASELDPRRFGAARPPVMLLGGLNIARALGLAGIPVIIASSDPEETAFASRYCSGRLLLPAQPDRAAVAELLLRVGERLSSGLGRRLPLFYGNDDWQRLVQDYRSDLARYYALLLNDAEVGSAVIEKDRFQPLAESCGLPIPRALAWEELEAFERPVLVKPRDKFAWELSAVHSELFAQGGKARVFLHGADLLSHAAARNLRDALLVQEYVGGDDAELWSFHGFADEAGTLLDWFVGRKIRTYPSLTGMSTYLELAHDEEVAALGRRTVSRLPLKGVFKIDLKRDGATGGVRLLEVNARYNLWHYLGAANGVNLPRTAYEYLLDGRRPAAAGRYSTTRRWVYLRYDWRAYRELAAHGKLSFAGWLASLLAGPLVCQLFAWSDPRPFLYAFYCRVRRQLPRLTAVLQRWLCTAS